MLITFCPVIGRLGSFKTRHSSRKHNLTLPNPTHSIGWQRHSYICAICADVSISLVIVVRWSLCPIAEIDSENTTKRMFFPGTGGERERGGESERGTLLLVLGLKSLGESHTRREQCSTGLGISWQTWVGLTLIWEVASSRPPAQPLLPISLKPRQN